MTQIPDAGARRAGESITDSTIRLEHATESAWRVEQLGLFNGPTVFAMRQPPAQASLGLPIRW